LSSINRRALFFSLYLKLVRSPISRACTQVPF
jgi:hypothetical protein